MLAFRQNGANILQGLLSGVVKQYEGQNHYTHDYLVIMTSGLNIFNSNHLGPPSTAGASERPSVWVLYRGLDEYNKYTSPFSFPLGYVEASGHFSRLVMANHHCARVAG